MIANVAMLIVVLALLAACASSISEMPPGKAQCNDVLQQRAGRSIDDLIVSLGSTDAHRDYVGPDQPGVSHWRASIKAGCNRSCGKLDVYTNAYGIVTGFNFRNPGHPKVPTNP